MSIFKRRNERDLLIKFMWDIVLRETADDNGKIIDDAGCEWFTLDNDTFIGSTEWCVSHDEEVANLVNAINALNGYSELINQEPQ